MYPKEMCICISFFFNFFIVIIFWRGGKLYFNIVEHYKLFFFQLLCILLIGTRITISMYEIMHKNLGNK